MNCAGNELRPDQRRHFEIITNVGPLLYRGQVQEFIVQIPEPATIVLLLMGIGTMFVLGLKRQRQQVAAEFSQPKIST